MKQGPPVELARVTTIELFFDLVFVFTITQVSHLLEQAHTVTDVVSALLVVTPIWWIYDGYAWLTTAHGAKGWMRFVLLAAMGGFLAIALTIPTVFSTGGLAFGLAYLFVVLLHFGAYTAASGRAFIRPILGVARINIAVSALIIAAGVIDAAWDWWLFVAATLLFIIATIRRRERAFPINAAHWAERHGLVVIIALGETVIAVGVAMADHALDAHTVGVMALSLLFITTLWWAYFDRDDARGEHALAHVAPEKRARIALLGYWYAHLAMIFGIVLIAPALHHFIAHEEGGHMNISLLALGLALYLGGGAFFRVETHIRPAWPRALGAVLALGLWPLTGLAALAGAAILVIAVLGVERRVEHAEP